MKIDHFDPPGNIDDLGNDAGLKERWSKEMSGIFDDSIERVTQFLQSHGGGTCQFYNPVAGGRTDPDLVPSLGDIPWNGFPKRFGATGPTHPTNFAAAEPKRNPGQARLQDEYLEWHVNRNTADKIVSIHFTCEAWDYFEFLATQAPDMVVALYQKFIKPPVSQVQLKADLFPGETYDRLNKWNTAFGAMHLTHSANNLGAEVFLGASATVRRQKDGVEITQSIPLIRCADYGDDKRNSDPNIGIAVNDLAREKRMITLANPVGLYMADFDGAGITLNGNPAGGFFRVVRGAFPQALRAVFELPSAEVTAGHSVSDVKIGGQALNFGGQLAERITMHLFGIASVDQAVDNAPMGCGAIPTTSAPALAAAAATFPHRRLHPRK
ncbi:MAG: hypothetical protein WA869_27740 [Alloacidobacterium sp.]